MFKINQTVFDSENKEYVKITNGFEKANGLIEPNEGIALRVLGFREGKPIIAFTYRKVNPKFLSACEGKVAIDTVFNLQTYDHYDFVGRV